VRPPDPFAARPATLGDAGDAAALINAFDRAYLEEPDEIDATEIAGWWIGKELERDTLVIRDPAGRLSANALLKEDDLEHWQQHIFGREWWDPSLVYLVREGAEVVAAEINAFRFGVGWIGTLGTRRPWRCRGLGRALLLTAFVELYRRGYRRIGLAVDAGNETGATHLYESVGMHVAWQADVYEKRR
jgi:ribosomal protein S18 acetylase RimI-like enzyme